MESSAHEKRSARNTVPLDDESTAPFGQTPSRFAGGVSTLSISDASALSCSMQAEKEAAVLAAKNEARASRLECELLRSREQHRAETQALQLRELMIDLPCIAFTPSPSSH